MGHWQAAGSAAHVTASHQHFLPDSHFLGLGPTSLGRKPAPRLLKPGTLRNRAVVSDLEFCASLLYPICRGKSQPASCGSASSSSFVETPWLSLLSVLQVVELGKERSTKYL